MSTRFVWSSLSDEQLLKQCGIDTYRASGPGGQKRNKTSSAVRLRHEPTGLIVIAEESRSQHQNKAKALRRLRQAFYLKMREPVGSTASEIAAIRGADGKLHVTSAKDARYWPAVGVLLDLLEIHSAQVSDVAAAIGTTTGNLLTILEGDAKVWEQANILRTKFGHKPLK